MTTFSRARFVQLWSARVPIVQIAREMNCCASTVTRWARRIGLEPRNIGGNRRGTRTRKDYSPIMERFAAELSTGATVRALAAKFRISTRTVCQIRSQLLEQPRAALDGGGDPQALGVAAPAVRHDARHLCDDLGQQPPHVGSAGLDDLLGREGERGAVVRDLRHGG